VIRFPGAVGIEIIPHHPHCSDIDLRQAGIGNEGPEVFSGVIETDIIDVLPGKAPVRVFIACIEHFYLFAFEPVETVLGGDPDKAVFILQYFSYIGTG
jgi:hypothetical protein